MEEQLLRAAGLGDPVRASHWTENLDGSRLLEQGFGDASPLRPLQGNMGELGEGKHLSPHPQDPLGR